MSKGCMTWGSCMRGRTRRTDASRCIDSKTFCDGMQNYFVYIEQMVDLFYLFDHRSLVLQSKRGRLKLVVYALSSRA